jgi:hypothetical protein
MLCGQFKPTADMVKGMERLAIRKRATILPEPERLEVFDHEGHASEECIVRFGDIRHGFAPLEGWDTRLRAELLRSMDASGRRLAARTEDFVIGVHVRRGDFYVVSEDAFTSWDGPHGARRTPMRWFVESVAFVRELLGRDAPAFVVSDGEPDEMEPLIALDHVTLLRGGSPLSDLIALSNAQVLIGSILSSFTAWASFLGQMTTVKFPAPSEDFAFVNRRGLYAGPLDTRADPPAEFVRDLKRMRP